MTPVRVGFLISFLGLGAIFATILGVGLLLRPHTPLASRRVLMNQEFIPIAPGACAMAGLNGATLTVWNARPDGTCWTDDAR